MKDIKPTYKHLELELENYCRDVKRIYIDKLSASGKGSGKLANTFEVKVSFNGNDVSVSINAEDYFNFVEHGRQPGKFPPLEQIQNWLQIKTIEPQADENGKLPTEKSLAFLIGRKIAEQGIEPGNQLAETQAELDTLYQKKFKDALQLDFDDFAVELNGEIFRILNI